MTTPTTLRALAARVVAGTATNEDVALAVGWRREPTATHFWQCPTTAEWRLGCPAFMTSRDAAAGLMLDGWLVAFVQRTDGHFVGSGMERSSGNRPISVTAPTEPQSRTALALLVRAAEMEGEKT